MQHTVVCGSLLETHLNEDFESSCPQQEEKPRIMLRDKSDGSRKRPLAGILTRPSIGGAGNAERQLPLKTKKMRATVRLKPKGNTEVSDTIRKRLLADIIAIFKAKSLSKMQSKQLLIHLCSDPKKPWAKFCRDSNLNYRQLSALLKGFDIHSKDMRFGNRSYKGYQMEWFVDAMRCCRTNKASSAKK